MLSLQGANVKPEARTSLIRATPVEIQRWKRAAHYCDQSLNQWMRESLNLCANIDLEEELPVDFASRTKTLDDSGTIKAKRERLLKEFPHTPRTVLAANFPNLFPENEGDDV